MKKRVMRTTEFSFVLKPSGVGGVGVFAVHKINQGAHLRLFGPEDGKDYDAIFRNKNSVPKVFRSFCIDMGSGGTLSGPSDLGVWRLGGI